MLIARIEGWTRECGKSQGYKGLPIRDEIVKDEQTGAYYNLMHSAWEPTPEDIENIKNGGKVILSQVGTNPQPVMLTTSK